MSTTDKALRIAIRRGDVEGAALILACFELSQNRVLSAVELVEHYRDSAWKLIRAVERAVPQAGYHWAGLACGKTIETTRAMLPDDAREALDADMEAGRVEEVDDA